MSRSASELSHQQLRPRTLTPLPAPEERGLLEAKSLQRFAKFLLASYTQGRPAGEAPSEQTPPLKKRELEELEAEVAGLKEKLSKMVSIAAGLMKRLPQRLAE